MRASLQPPVPRIALESADDEELRDELRRAIVGILSDLEPGDPQARAARRRLSAALS